MEEDEVMDKIKDMLNENEYRDTKKELRQFIFQETKNKKQLDVVKKNVREKWNKSLNNLEHDYIDRKFIKYCTQFWLDDIYQLVTGEIKNKKSQDVLMSIDHIKEIKNIPKLYQSSEYYEMLNSHNSLVTESHENILIHKIKLICLELTMKYNTTAKKELEFISQLASFLDTNYDNQDILSNLDLAGFISGKISFEIFLNSIIRLSATKNGKTNSDTTLLIRSAENLQNEKEFTLLKKIEDIVRDFLKPADIHEKGLQDRIIIEIKSRNLKLSEILKKLHSLMRNNSDIVEVQFIVSKNFYIDSDLNKDIWHGKNIGILTKNIHVIKNVSWDISGQNSNHNYDSNAGTENDGRGKDGADGYPGESGGNVLILAKTFLNQDYLSISSNGGNGSDGQNGGNGVDGANGEGIDRSEFKEKFPSVVKFASSMWERTKKVKEMVRYIKHLAYTTHCEWYTDENEPGACDVFLEVTTRQGNHITFSYCRGGLTRRYQGFLLYKGSLGKPGKAGGKNGLGGEGGFPGNIEVRHLENQEEFKVQKHLSKGTKGKHGKVGSYGKHGKNSWDMGYMDYQFWGETVVYDSKDNNINIVYYESNSSDRVWCPYKEAYNRYSFAEMEVQKIKHPQQITYENNERTEENSDRQHASKANKKKNVLTSNLYKDYQIIDLEESNKYKDLNSQFKEIDLLTMKAFSTSDNNQNHKLGVRSNINKVTNYNFSYENKNNVDHTNILHSKYRILKDNNSAKCIPGEFISVDHTKLFVDELQNLKNIPLNLNNLNLIYKKWSKCKSKFKKQSNQEKIELIFVEKYRIAVLQELSQKVNLDFEKNFMTTTDDTNELSAAQAVIYLNYQNKKFTNIHHNDLGSFRQYIFDNEDVHREAVMKFCLNGFLETNKDIFGHVYSKYFLETFEKDIQNKDVKKHFYGYHAFLKDKKQKIITHYNIFKSELYKCRHKGIFQIVLSKTIDECAGNDLKNEIENDPFLKILYKRLKKQFEISYDWEKCFEDIKNFKDFFNFIMRRGPQTACYRELLSHIYDINIRVYYLNDKEEFALLDNHNGTSRNIIYFLYRNGTFSEIDINSEYLNLNKHRELNDNLFSRIISDIYAINSKESLLDYLLKFDILSFSKQNIKFDQIIQEKIDEENEINEISKFFPIDDQEQVRLSLQKIASHLTGHSGILGIILRRFKYEGKHVVVKEIRYLVNSILDSCLNNKKLENIISWITATAIQSNWMAELIVMELESFFKSRLVKSKIQMFLTKLNADILLIFGMKIYKCKQQNIVLSSKYVEDTLYILNNINDVYINLEDIELSEWLYVLKEQYWISKLEKLFKWKESELGSVPYYILSLENMFGMSMVSQFLDILAEKKILQIQDITTFDGILQNFVDERWNLGVNELEQLRNINSLPEWVLELDEKFYASDVERNAKQLIRLIEENSNTSPNILKHLRKILNSLHNVKDEQYLHDTTYCVEEMSVNDIKKFVQFRNYDDKIIQSEVLLAIINRAIKLKRGFQLRDTQKLTILSFLLNENSTLAQVSTGEGKSLIVVAISIMKALKGEKVDIVTSSSVLAIRDAFINKDLYELFNVSVGHNCSEVIKTRKESYSSNKVIYGDLSNFQRDYLLDRFYGENILGDHDFSNIIIDEVDSMLLDKGNNTLYLSHDIAGLDKLESVYVYIWSSVNRPIQDATNISDFMNIAKIKESILNDIYGIIKKNDLKKLDEKLDELKKIKIWNFLVANKIIKANGRLIVQSIRNVHLNTLPTDLIYLKEHITYMLRECIERQRFIYVPKYLNQFIEKHLESWIQSAFAAYFMKAGHDYVVDVDRTKTISDGNPIITIIDRATGTDQVGSQWDNALHQFLQLKHGCKLTMQSLKAVFISNVSYFKLYGKLYGLTGTLGSERERDLLKEVHAVDFVTVPTAKSKKFHEYIPIVCNNKETWIKSIQEEVVMIVNKEVRSILIICQFVEDVELIKRKLVHIGTENIHTYTRDYEEFHIAQGSQKLKESQIIIATNLAGRGTDIILSDTLKEKGGLHVCLTYLPTNTRIERQAFGRAARCGDNGTGRLIVVDENYQVGVTSKVLNIKKDRDAEELNRISSINVEYNNRIKTEERCFDKFKRLFEKIKNQFTTSEIAPEVKSILLQCCLDSWAFWLDENTSNTSTEDINYYTFNESFQLFYDRLGKYVFDLTPAGVVSFNTQKCFDFVKQNPTKMVILGKYFLSQNNLDQALALFNAVINNEKDFSEAAHYYKAFAISKQIDWELSDARCVSRLYYISRMRVSYLNILRRNRKLRKMFKDELLKSARLFQDHAERSLHYATIIDKIKENYPNSIIQIQAYTEQKHIFSNFYNIFAKSVDDILGAPVMFQCFSSNDINEPHAQDVYNNLLTKGFLNQTKIKKTIRELDLEPISQDFAISTKVLQSFLENYKNRYIDEKSFIKDLKNHINLPSCGKFWKILLEQGILYNEEKYVIVDTAILNKIDPSYLESLKEKITSGNIPTPNTDVAYDQNNSTKIVFISGVCIKEQINENTLLFYKNDLKAINEAKYLMLKRKGALTFNKMAYIGESKISATNLVQYDSISLDDFSKININKEQGNEILRELISEDLIERKQVNENKFIYKLKEKYENIFEIKLKSREIYKSNVIGLLLSCFAYRIAVQKLQKQLKDSDQNIQIPLMTKPHYSIFYQLIEQKILKNVKVTKNRKITENCVKDLFGLPITEEKFIQLLESSEIIPIEKAPELFDNLVSANWIHHCNVIGQVLHGKLYNITADEDRLSLNSKFRPFEKSVKLFLRYTFLLGSENSLRCLTKTLNQLQTPLKSLSVPDNILKPLTDFSGSNKFSNVDEMYVMSLNGLDHIQVLEEKKNTTIMLISTAIVFGFGLIQLAVGVIILYYSMGFMTHVGSTLISEGISDMLFATSAYKSGYFSWNDYMQHKVQSLIFSAISVGVGAIFSWGARYSRFGYKLFGPALQETCGKELIKKTGYMVIVKSISVEVLKGIAICAANYGADALIDRHLKSFCEDVGSAITSSIETEVDSNELSSRLMKVYQMYGESKAKKALGEITDTFFHNHNIGNNIQPTAMKISNSIVKGVKEAVNKKTSGGSGFLFTVKLIEYCGEILTWSNRLKDLYMIKSVTKDFVDNLCKEIDEKLINTQDNQNVSEPEVEFCQEKYDEFKKEITENWKRIVRQQSGRILSQTIVSPILEHCLKELITLCGRTIKNVYRYAKEKCLESKLKELRQEFKKKMEENKTRLVEEGDKTNKAITEKYCKDVLKLLEQTKDPKLFANMILENIPMDLTCSLASGKVIEAVFKKLGKEVPAISITFKTEERIEQEILLGPEGERKQVTVNLKNNHFQISGTENLPNSNFENAENDCLYQSLAAVIPELRELGPNNFRIAMAQQILENPDIQRHIENGWHKYPIRLDLFGGAKKYRIKSSRRKDVDSNDSDIKDPADHIFDRFIRTFRVAAVVQQISKSTDIPPENILREGPSEYQDRHSNLGPEYHAGHIIRVVIDDCLDPSKHPKAFNELKTILGHTQTVPKFVNEYHGVGGVIDGIQADAIRMATFCDFNTYNPDDRDIFNNIKNAFVDDINNFLDKSVNLTESNRIDIEEGLQRIYNTSPREMFKSGRKGYSRRYRDAYM